MVQELFKNFEDEEFDRLEEEYLSQIFGSDEETDRIQATAVEKSIEAVDKCKTKEEFEALMGEDL